VSDALREITVNGIRYLRADDVEEWHRQLVERSEELDRLENDPYALRAFVARIHAA
jgi:hypothetical protein